MSANVEEPGKIDSDSETVSCSAGPTPEAEVEALPWRGTYCVAHTEKILFSQNVEFRTSDLPRWKPRVIIDPHTPLRVNERQRVQPQVDLKKPKS